MYDTNREGNPVSLDNLIAELEAATGAILSSREAKHRIWTAVGKLAPPERNLLNMIYFREEARRSDQELANELGIDGPVGTAKSTASSSSRSPALPATRRTTSTSCVS